MAFARAEQIALAGHHWQILSLGQNEPVEELISSIAGSTFVSTQLRSSSAVTTYSL